MALRRLALLLFPALLAAQQFEVASVKPSTSGFNGNRGGCHGIDSRGSQIGATPVPLGRCVITDARLSHLIYAAWALPAIRLIQNAPDWVIAGSERFDIHAEAADPTKTTEQELLHMLQNLLIDRFKLKFHNDTHEEMGYALLPGKSGPRMKPSGEDEPSGMLGGKPGQSTPLAFTLQHYSMPMLAGLLSALALEPIVDETGLNGFYDIKLSWDETAGPTLPTALEEQVGLRLSRQKVPVSYFVFESAERPSAN